MNKFIKHLSVWASLAAAVALGACSGAEDSATVNLLPASVGNGQFRVYCDSEVFTEALEKMDSIENWQVHPCVNNIIAIDRSARRGSPLISLYRVKGNELEELASELMAAGFMNEGRIPVVRYGEAPSVLDKDMKEVFRAQEVDGIAVKAVAAMYSQDRLWFSLEDGTAGCFDRDGQVVFRINERLGAKHFFADGLVTDVYGDPIDLNGNRVEQKKTDSDDSDDSGAEPSIDENIASETEALVRRAAPFNVKPMLDFCEKIEDKDDRFTALYNMVNGVDKELKVELSTGINAVNPLEVQRAFREREAVIEKAGPTVLTRYGIGKILIGNPAGWIPRKVDGVYDNYKVDRMVDDMSGLSSVYTCTRNGKDVMYIQIDENRTIHAVIVVDPAIKALSGAYIDMPEAELKKLPGLQKVMDDMEGTWYYHGDDIVYYLSDDSTPTVTMMSTAGAFI